MSGAKVFVPDSTEAWIPAVVNSQQGNEANVSIIVEAAKFAEPGNIGINDRVIANIGGASKTVKVEPNDDRSSGLPLRDDACFKGEGVEDMTMLNYLHEAAILFNLRTRFFAARPYTYTGDICIAVNPYQWLDIYTETTRKEYYVMGRQELPPHAYATSAAAFNGIQEGGPNQSVLVSGESGAGKTETVKILMAHVAYIAAGDDQSVIKRILDSNPLLETFGNAKTTRNDNSSRFGKFTELQFDKKSRLVGSVSRTYLLEKSRVIHQTAGERNFHVFHQVLSADDAALHAQLHLGTAELAYVREGSRTQVIEGKTDTVRRGITLTALDLIGVGEEDRARYQQIIAAILHVGEIAFVEKAGDSERSEVSPGAGVGPVADLLGVDAAAFADACTERTMVARDDVYKVPLKAAEAAGAASGLAKALYARLFDALVVAINLSTSAALASVHRTIAMLDIFGFEMFKVNSFEQLCINFANEKLQQKFTHDVFKTVQQEYKEEGIAWEAISFVDNEATLNLIEARMGIISVLNEECMRPMGNDEAFNSKLTTLHQKHPDFSNPKLNARKCFSVRHYAGGVTYTVDGFLEKNKDVLQDDLHECMAASCNPLVARLFQRAPAAAADDEDNGGKKRAKGGLMQDTVSTKFKLQLGQLMATIGATAVQYVRCIKPNAVKSKEVFQMQMVVEQLRCAGVIEAIRITRAGFPNKMKHREFLSRFGLLAPAAAAAAAHAAAEPGSPTKASAASHQAHASRSVLGAVFEGRASSGAYEVGTTRAYFKAGVLEELEGRRTVVLTASATVLQRCTRGAKQRKAYQGMRLGARVVQSCLRMHKAQAAFKKVRRGVVRLQSLERARQDRAMVMELRRHVRARTIQSYARMFGLRAAFVEQRQAATYLEAWARMQNAKRTYELKLAEAKEQAKMENQLAALQKRLDREAEARGQMEAENVALQERLKSGKALPTDAAEGNGAALALSGSGNVLVDQSILDESSQMLEFLKKENAKVKDENARLQRNIAKLQREAAHLRQSTDTAEATMKVLSQHAKALAQAHMKLQSAKEEADSNIKKYILKEERLAEELQMKHAMYIAEVNARIQDREVMGSMVSLAEADPNCPDELVFKLRDLLERSAQTGMVDEGPDGGGGGGKQGNASYRRVSSMFKGLFD